MTLKRILTAVLLTFALLTPVLAQPLANKSAKNEEPEVEHQVFRSDVKLE